jgi:aspartyl-tRNA(Asn)/glutamyl-tRNA(Gln) amidotransferase subunit B
MLRTWLVRNTALARPRGCLHGLREQQLQASIPAPSFRPISRTLKTEINAQHREERIPLRKQLKDEAKNLKAQKRQKGGTEESQKLDEWELTVGIEIHAQLNTEAKLFSSECNDLSVLISCGATFSNK